MSKTGSAIADIVRGSFLGNERITKLLPFAVYVTFLALVVIYYSHSADRKVHRINALRTEVDELKSEYLDTKTRLMQLGLESTVEDRVAELGLKTSEHPPIELVVEND
ncbi:MAG: S-adenosyl-methyltransferase [Bacteroidetes bacterium]|uniref:S-adenosyl-methyltransferase n=1 Tax=Phaeocystidibacter marisrubri TaxID=1577780 RepID=A0A6L3ZGT1_9FLAO|nr:FtsL-like putative cell division protein [Phaeocystidibacter marisrubri]KAB2816839.1 S-adenosyl-methyltransferase [Phaeocystidibacter marisrubri]TNE29680.1 MAG: S-adenosyl-methyltransferase [Bacteroidota bacterium]GGH77929.1 hypothetical protein GCM10011318_28440 [Phaeocystidibacter marisrubri]